MSTHTLALCRQAPYGSALAREGLEAVLAAAAMDQAPDVLFLGDGVFQLTADQAPQEIGQKSLYRNLQALPMFGVERIYVCRQSLADRGISTESIAVPGIEVELVTDPGALLARYQHVLSF
ncbi:sulfurtransferase complex subunit TusC [Microbulbifer flavimaris]|uniref:Sulfurtransferase complex subunit TusC n=1 Tax=Microbulbifer flavimaris TaxID=1781068 RepID=A0ABX4I3K1_9GAMM|nr:MULTISPECIES: sulfurtransferase complex subunit TusC [Microbulbifer]KUJ84674.1 sulfur relay protein TusC [Microbulbifer sp. ZGT114]PCO06763.1 sulfurtransferase complex subunit TusC [Microbulbifer flavimaris]